MAAMTNLLSTRLYAIALVIGFSGYLAFAWFTRSLDARLEFQPLAIEASNQTAKGMASQLDGVDRTHTVLEVKLSDISDGAADGTTVENASTDNSRQACNDICRQIVATFGRSGASFDWERAPSDKLVSQLARNARLRTELIKIAVEASGDKRQFIIAAFSQLKTGSQWALGKALSEASEYNQRLDGIHLLANPATMNKAVGMWFTGRLETEQDLYVRSALIKALSQTDLFYGDSRVAQVLSNVIATDADSSVRGEALLAKVRLAKNPQASLSDSLAAVRSSSSEYQQYGALALEQVVTRQTLQGAKLDSQSESAISQLVAELMNPEFDDMPLEVRKSLDNLYSRFL